MFFLLLSMPTYPETMPGTQLEVPHFSDGERYLEHAIATAPLPSANEEEMLLGNRDERQRAID